MDDIAKAAGFTVKATLLCILKARRNCQRIGIGQHEKPRPPSHLPYSIQESTRSKV